jgi:di/tricarboxylate transporter
MGDRQVDVSDPYLERLKKLIPTEVSAAFLAINSLIPLDSDKDTFAILAAIILAIVCWFYLKRLQKVTALSQLAFTSLIAFPVWATNIMISRFDWLVANSYAPSCILIVVTVVAPLISSTPLEP